MCVYLCVCQGEEGVAEEENKVEIRDKGKPERDMVRCKARKRGE